MTADARTRILDAAEDVLRQHGPAKTNVVDVARRLGMSHANIYRHFTSKLALQEAVAARWLAGVTAPLTAIAEADGAAELRLRAWLDTLVAAKRRKVTQDPALFATYHALAEATRGVVDAHVAELRGQLARIVADGVAQGAFTVGNPERAAAVILAATMRHHHPHFVRELPEDAAGLHATMALLLAGLRAGVV